MKDPLSHIVPSDKNKVISEQNNSPLHKLDKNEHVFDINDNFKKLVISELSHESWNRYPTLDYSNIESGLASYCNLKSGKIVLAPGAASILSAILNYYSINGYKINILQPSYAFMTFHCQSFNIPFTPWWLDDNFSFNLDALPRLDKLSVLIFASPNNPTGSVLSMEDMKKLLRKFPTTTIVLDAVYQEYGDIDYTPLIEEFDNLMIVRSFSKAFPAAGLRLGYLCAGERLANLVKKLILPYSINHFAFEFATILMNNPEILNGEIAKITQIKEQRDLFYKRLKTSFSDEKLKVYPSAGNFFLIKIMVDDIFEKFITLLNSKGIKVLETHKQKQLSNTIRLSIGLPQEMEEVFECLTEAFND